MIEHLPSWISLLFIITAMAAIGFFYYSNGKPTKMTLFIIVWSIIQSVLAYTGFYENGNTTPPRFALILVPSWIMIIYGLLPKQQQWVANNRNTKISTFLHTLRIPVETVLFGLFLHQMIPELMTFEGRNYDIVIGITAPIIGWLFVKGMLGKKALLAWNVIGLGFVLFIFANAILSAELPFQQFGFDQPNRAVVFFPFVLLPATIVPIVIWTHLSDIIKLRRELSHPNQ